MNQDNMEQQQLRLHAAERDCILGLNQTNIIEKLWCPAIWDGILCWPTTPFNSTAEQQCPNYVVGFNHIGTAYKKCTESGTWFFNEQLNNTWTNFTDCVPKNLSHHFPKDDINLFLFPHIENFRIISKIGYSVSFGTLLIAFFILNFVKRLRCPRNNLHLQLFASFMIRSIMFLIKYMFDSTRTPQGSDLRLTDSSLSLVNNEESVIVSSYINDNPAISCKIFTTVWQYSLVANYNWILMEGLYLHNLIFLHIFNDNSSIMRYIILGWGLPILFIVPWVVVRALYEDTLCWTTNEDKRIFWIIRGPITATIILNFIFFINITRVLFLKMFSSSAVNSVRQYKYRTWFKSTFILVPLFGVHYMFLLVFSSLSAISYDIFEIIWLYIDLLFSSFQGCVVALLYCFFNGEVQTELHKLWQSWRRCNRNPNHNHQSNHSTTHLSYLTQSLTYLSRGRNSCFSTTTGDNGVVNRKDTQTQSRSPSPPIRTQITTNLSHSFRDDNKISNNMSSVVVMCDKQHNLNDNTCPTSAHKSTDESMM